MSEETKESQAESISIYRTAQGWQLKADGISIVDAYIVMDGLKYSIMEQCMRKWGDVPLNGTVPVPVPPAPVEGELLPRVGA